MAEMTKEQYLAHVDAAMKEAAVRSQDKFSFGFNMEFLDYLAGRGLRLTPHHERGPYVPLKPHYVQAPPPKHGDASPWLMSWIEEISAWQANPPGVMPKQIASQEKPSLLSPDAVVYPRWEPRPRAEDDWHGKAFDIFGYRIGGSLDHDEIARHLEAINNALLPEHAATLSITIHQWEKRLGRSYDGIPHEQRLRANEALERVTRFIEHCEEREAFDIAITGDADAVALSRFDLELLVLGITESMAAATSALYLDDIHGYRGALGNIVRFLRPDLFKLMEDGKYKAAYDATHPEIAG